MNPAGWRAFFQTWSTDMPRRGVLVTSFGEQIPFTNFLIAESLLLIERPTPDTLGARSVVLPYENVAAVKITDVVKPKALRAVGFEGPMPKT